MAMNRAEQRAYDKGVRAGVTQGRQQARKEVLDFLGEEYMGPNAPARGSERGEAILELARKIAKAVAINPNEVANFDAE